MKVSYANSFLPRRNTMGPCPPVISSEAKRSPEISLRKVSCRNETQRSYAGQETICEKFPAAMKHSGAMPDRKPYATSFLSQ